MLQIIPLTVLTAILVFIAREVLETMRRHKGEVRERQALRSLLARECELNHGTIKAIRHIVRTIHEDSASDPRVEFSFEFLRGGRTMFRVQASGTDIKTGSVLPPTHRSLMTSYLLRVATIDRELYAVLQPAYDALADLEHVRENLIYYVAPEDEQDAMHLDGFLRFADEELNRIHGLLGRLYQACAGQPLSTHRLR
ncbi:hypothetical protein PY257_07360 [Ramlibacter sp. H39-3-26]|uniref:hypothetical protein n=1 Tax=Curvibacter soli TaxID=3031331 RepID=UPI0023DC2CD9|nr:hypothetical protein [Ramlibacter sp. H39-3-26]MDF1485005.1 hypothetical protein [Ramlibacter sp. H39-3-26]